MSRMIKSDQRSPSISTEAFRGQPERRAGDEFFRGMFQQQLKEGPDNLWQWAGQATPLRTLRGNISLRAAGRPAPTNSVAKLTGLARG